MNNAACNARRRTASAVSVETAPTRARATTPKTRRISTSGATRTGRVRPHIPQLLVDRATDPETLCSQRTKKRASSHLRLPMTPLQSTTHSHHPHPTILRRHRHLPLKLATKPTRAGWPCRKAVAVSIPPARHRRLSHNRHLLHVRKPEKKRICVVLPYLSGARRRAKRPMRAGWPSRKGDLQRSPPRRRRRRLRCLSLRLPVILRSCRPRHLLASSRLRLDSPLQVSPLQQEARLIILPLSKPLQKQPPLPHPTLLAPIQRLAPMRVRQATKRSMLRRRKRAKLQPS